MAVRIRLDGLDSMLSDRTNDLELAKARSRAVLWFDVAIDGSVGLASGRFQRVVVFSLCESDGQLVRKSAVHSHLEDLLFRLAASNSASLVFLQVPYDGAHTGAMFGTASIRLMSSAVISPPHEHHRGRGVRRPEHRARLVQESHSGQIHCFHASRVPFGVHAVLRP